ncbi:sugar phosphate isomerase/epimerase, partial [bacterium]|nr:sugar phosphate isomerase/epimerase [bacterium]
FKRNFIAFCKDFIKEFERRNLIAVIENVFEDSPEFCLNLYEGINSPNLKLALDTGHVNLYAQETKVTDWIKAYGKNLYHLHIHNNYRKNDDHSNLTDGTLNFNEIFNEIKAQNINPTFVLEMFTEEDIRKSVEVFNALYLN